MPVSFRDAQDIDELGTAAYLRIEREPGGGGSRGALFIINARGEPLQFTYARANCEYSALWGRRDIERHAARKLAETLFASCPQAPRILLYFGEEVPRAVFDEDLAVSVAICHVSTDAESARKRIVESVTAGISTDAFNVSWLPARPAAGSAEMRLFAELARRDLVLDGFERATRGLREVYPAGSPT